MLMPEDKRPRSQHKGDWESAVWAEPIGEMGLCSICRLKDMCN